MDKKNINVLIHSINGVGLGHIKRLVLIANELKKYEKIGKIIFVSNSSNPFLIENEGYIVEKLEYGIEDTVKDISFDTYELENFGKINSIIIENNINLIIHDTYFIKNLLLKRKDLIHFLVIRDSNLDYLKTIEKYLNNFRKIFIPHIKEEFSKEKQEFYSLYSNIIYSGYVVEKRNFSINKTNKIIISPGYGGDYENVKVFFEYLNNLLSINIKLFKGLQVEFVLGKYDEKLLNEICFNKNFKTVKFIENLAEKIGEFKLFIGRCGYNTVNEVILNGTNSILFPVNTTNENQFNRIDFFINNFNVNYVVKGVYNNKKDIENLKNLLSINFIQLNCNLDLFNGSKNISNEIIKELNKENILVFKHIFIPKSENFIFEELNGFSNLNPVICTLKKENIEIFNNSFEVFYNQYFTDLLNLDYPKIQNKDLYIKFLKYLVTIIKKNKIKIIYTEFLFDAYFICKIRNIISDIKIFSASRGYDIYSFLNYNYINKNDFLSSLDGIFVRDNVMKKKLIDIGYNKINIIRTFIDFKKYIFEEKDFNKIDLVIGGRFTEKKNLLELLDLVKLLYSSGTINKISIVGDGKLAKKIVGKINDLNLGNFVKMYGFLEHKDLLNVLKDYNCFINYSKKAINGDDEGIPNLLVENILCGNLVFSTNTGGIKELFSKTEENLLTGNICDDLIKINSIIKNNHLITKLIVKNYKEVKEIYKKINSINKLENKLLKNKYDNTMS